MTDSERSEVLRDRKGRGQAWHSPPTWATGSGCYMITAACYEHSNHIGYDGDRLSEFSRLAAFERLSSIQAWVVLPNHYHVLLETADVVAIKAELKRLHGRTAFAWNGVEGRRGRKVWHAAAETRMKSDGHY